MFADLRFLASAVLLVASLCAPASTGIVLAHVVHEHAATAEHGHAHDGHEGGHGDAEPGAEHDHQLRCTTAAAPARIGESARVLLPTLAAPREDFFDLPAAHVPARPMPPAWRAGPPEPRRHTILLL